MNSQTDDCVPPGIPVGIALHLPALPDAALPGDGGALATLLFAQLLEARLTMAGVLIGRVGAVGPFSKAVFLCVASDLMAALTTAKTVCEHARIAAAAEIGWWDDREEVWRQWRPVRSASSLNRLMAPDNIKCLAEADFESEQSPANDSWIGSNEP